jgi:hypothetical protein
VSPSINPNSSVSMTDSAIDGGVSCEGRIIISFGEGAVVVCGGVVSLMGGVGEGCLVGAGGF